MAEGLSDDEQLVFDDRLTRRTTVLLAGQIIHHRRAYRCTIRDISAGGCRADVEADFEAGTPVHLDIGRHGRFPAVIAWVEGRRLGLAFAQSVGQTLAQFGPAAAALGLVDRLPDAIDVARIGHGK